MENSAVRDILWMEVLNLVEVKENLHHRACRQNDEMIGVQIDADTQRPVTGSRLENHTIAVFGR